MIISDILLEMIIYRLLMIYTMIRREYMKSEILEWIIIV